jgi:hypothetical protein
VLIDKRTTKTVAEFIPKNHIIIAAKATEINIETKFNRKLLVKIRGLLLNPDKGISHKTIGIIKRNINSISIIINHMQS